MDSYQMQPPENRLHGNEKRQRAKDLGVFSV
jgi:hypothetical protein